MVKNGRTSSGKQRLLCKKCGARFNRQYQTNRQYKALFKEYVFGKQTLKQLAEEHGRTKETIRSHLDRYRANHDIPDAGPVVLCMDCTFFGRDHGIFLIRCPALKKNLYWKEITTENKAVYQEARKYLEKVGFDIQAVVLDIKPGIREVFSDLTVQACQYHEQQIIQRYLTSRPKTEAGQELKRLADLLTMLDEASFLDCLEAWQGKWQGFLKERTYAEDNKHWWYTHKRLRSAYRSLKINLPYLFTYQKHPELGIPNTNNSLEGMNSRLKQLLNNHHGLRRWRRYKLIEAILND